MMRLVRHGLMFGNLIEVRNKALVSRYNRALKHLIGKETDLTEFHIDICGYSPEIGDELEDELYLNPKGCNQQFILLTTEQKKAPLLSSKFSTSRSIIRDFIEDNEEELFAIQTHLLSKTGFYYPIMKIVDMYFWQIGLRRHQQL